jgi:hypothetical protein
MTLSPRPKNARSEAHLYCRSLYVSYNGAIQLIETLLTSRLSSEIQHLKNICIKSMKFSDILKLIISDLLNLAYLSAVLARACYVNLSSEQHVQT